MRLYGYWRSSSAYRVRILLNLKGLDYEYVPVHLLKNGGEQNATEFVQKSPLHQVPLLELRGPSGGLYLSQSMAIAEFLEEAHPTPPLFPKDAWGKARARELAEMINSGIQPLHNVRLLKSLRTMGADPRAWCREVIARGFHGLEARLRVCAGTHAVGETLSIVEAFLIPQLYSARRFELDLEPFPTILRVEAACKDDQAFIRAHPDNQSDAPPVEERTL